MFVLVARAPEAPFGEVFFTGTLSLRDDGGRVIFVPDVSDYPEDAFKFYSRHEPQDLICHLDLDCFRVADAAELAA